MAKFVSCPQKAVETTTMRKSGEKVSIDRMSLSRSIIIGLMIIAANLSMSPPANAAFLKKIGILGPLGARLTCLLGRLACKVDPENVEAFSLSIKFDPSVLQFSSITYFAPYEETTPPDLSQISEGLILNIAGSTEDPPPGDVFLFEVNYTPVVSGTTPLGYDTIFAGAGDFIDAFDPSTGQITFVGPSQIPPADCPEPASFLVLGTALLGAVGVGRRRFRADPISS